MAGSNCYNRITLRQQPLINLDSVIDKYQICVFSTTCDSPTVAMGDCLNVDRVQVFCRDAFLVRCCSCVQLVILWGFRCDHCQYIVNYQNCANINSIG